MFHMLSLAGKITVKNAAFWPDTAEGVWLNETLLTLSRLDSLPAAVKGACPPACPEPVHATEPQTHCVTRVTQEGWEVNLDRISRFGFEKNKTLLQYNVTVTSFSFYEVFFLTS